LEMQRLQPEMRRLQTEFKGDRQKLNEAMMKLYQEHKVNPLASCLPIAAQMPVFIIMFQALNGLIKRESGSSAFAPKFLNKTSELYLSLVGKTKMESFGIDLALTPINAVKDNFATGLIYVFLVAALAALYFVQQKMVASRTVSPTMSATQAKVMQYLPVFFAVFQLFLPTGLIVYYMVQAIIRIGQQQYITQRFYGHDSSLGRQAQAAGERAREMSKNDKESSKSKKEVTDPKAPFVSKRVTPPKGGFSSAKQSTPPGKNRSNAIPRKPKKS